MNLVKSAYGKGLLFSSKGAITTAMGWAGGGIMAKRFLVLTTSIFVLGAALYAQPAAAQGRSYGVVVLHDVGHAISPALSHIRPIPPAKGLQRVIPLLLTHPVQPRLIQRDPLLQQSTTGISQATASTSFMGIGVGLGNITSDSYIPPDTNGAAGPTQYVQWVNASFAVFNKFTGAVEYGPAAGNTLWSSLGGPCATYNSGDPIAQFDKQADRWVMMQPVFTKPYYLCVAVSLTPDAVGAYHTYQFPVPNNSHNFPDYPKLAVWPDGYYVSFNSFYNGSTYQGPTACVLDRSAMLNGQTATIGCAGPLGSSYSPILPADLDGDVSGVSSTTAAPPPEADYYLNFGSNSLNVWQFNSSLTTFSLIQTIQVPSFSEACGGGACIPQANTKQQLDSLGDRMMYRLAYRNLNGTETLVASQSVDTGNGNTGVRWYELQNSGSGWGYTQASTWDPDSNYRWMPSIAMDEAQDIALGYSVSGSGINPAIAFTGHEYGVDSTNAMETETPIINGTGSQTTYNRWGDYSSMSVDPTDDCTLWYTNEYLQTTGNFNWSTQIAPIRFSNCPTLDLQVAAPAGSTADPTSQTVTAGSSANYTLSVNPSGGGSTVSTSFTVSGLPSGANYTVSSVSGSGSTTLNVTTSSSTPAGTYTLNIAATGGGVTNASSVVLTVNGSAPPVTVSSVSLSPNPVTGGSSSTGTVTLSGAAPSGGAVVSLSSSDTSAAQVPTSVTVASGATSANFTVTTSSVSSQTTVTITASYNSSSQSATLTVNPASSGGSFTLGAASSYISVSPGSSVTDGISITSSGFTGSVSLSVSGLPKFVSGSFSVNPVSVTTSGGSSVLTISANKHAGMSAGTYSLTITGTGGGSSSSTTVSLTVN
jgi:hypothetical protein